jgi:hypothetical protein
VGWLCSLCHYWRLDEECNQSCFEVRMIKPAMDLDLHSWKVQSNEKGNLIHWQGMTRFAWWQQDLHAIELLRAHIGEWTITRMLDYWRVMCFTGYRLNWNPWIWIPFPVDSDCTLLCIQVDRTRIQQYCIRQ